MQKRFGQQEIERYVNWKIRNHRFDECVESPIDVRGVALFVEPRGNRKRKKEIGDGSTNVRDGLFLEGLTRLRRVHAHFEGSRGARFVCTMAHRL